MIFGKVAHGGVGFSVNKIHDDGQDRGKTDRKAFDSIGLVSLLHVLEYALNEFFIYMSTNLYFNSFVIFY